MNTRKESNKKAKNGKMNVFQNHLPILNSNGTITPKMLINCVQTRERKNGWKIILAQICN